MKLRLILFAFLLGSITVSSQINQNNALPSVLPSAPSAFEFLKYGEIPISKYTGVPSISIPIYTIKARGLDIPIGLTYHSNGFRVNEEAGWTGLGWTLNPEGNIVQIIKGFDDFGPRSNRNFLDADAIADVAGNGAPNGAFTNCNSDSSMSISSNTFSISYPLPSDSTGEPSNAILPVSLMIGDKDYEPDVFQFNVLGYSGKFVLDWETETFICLTDSSIKVEKTQGSHGQITIRLPDGHYCLFSVKEESTKEYWNTLGVMTNNGAPYLDGEVLSRIYKLDHIYTNQNDHIEFFYEITAPLMSSLEVSSQYVTYEDLGPDELATGTYGNGWGSGLWNEEVKTFSKTKQPMSFLSKIIFNKGVVLFSTSARSDISGAKKLDKIQVKENEVSSDVIKEFNFIYDYFMGNTNGTSNENQSSYPNSRDSKTITEKTYRLKLTSLSELGMPAYTFEYNNTQLPKKNSWATDYWGYYNGKLDNQTSHVNLYRFEYQLNAPTGTFQYSNTNNKSANEQYTKAAVLEKITYPTGGYTTFEYELNTFDNYKIPNYSFGNNPSYPTNHISYGGGLRIKKIRNFNHDGSSVSQKMYSYIGGKIMTPLQFFNKAYIPQFYYVKHYHPVTGTDWGYAYGYRRKQSSSSLLAPSTNASGSYVGYDTVIEHFVSKDSETEHIGSIETDYENHVDEGFYNITNENNWYSQGRFIELGLPSREANKPRNGSVIEERVMDKNGQTVQKSKMEYGSKIRTYCVTGAKFGPMYSSGWSNTNPDRKYTLGFYPIRGLDSYLMGKETTLFNSTGSIVTKEEYFYNEYLQMKEHRITNSDGSVLYNYMKYGIDNQGSNPSLGQLSNLVEVKSEKNGKVISHFSYNYLGSVLSEYPINVKIATSDLLGNDIATFYGIDNKGNLDQISSRNGALITKYIWDYYGKYPLVKMEGSDAHNWPSSTYINAVVNASQDYNNDTGLKTAMDQLRSHSNVHVTTYTYENLVGVKSITSPQGITTTYHYDDLNRLLEVRDHQGNILSKNEYNYKQ